MGHVLDRLDDVPLSTCLAEPLFLFDEPSTEAVTSWKNDACSLSSISRNCWKFCELTGTERNIFDRGDIVMATGVALDPNATPTPFYLRTGRRQSSKTYPYWKRDRYPRRRPQFRWSPKFRIHVWANSRTPSRVDFDYKKLVRPNFSSTSSSTSLHRRSSIRKQRPDSKS